MTVARRATAKPTKAKVAEPERESEPDEVPEGAPETESPESPAPPPVTPASEPVPATNGEVSWVAVPASGVATMPVDAHAPAWRERSTEE
jgi:hypothetical protein